jgi:magnesium chelatase family protein
MPDITLEESIDTTKIHSVVGLIPSENPVIASRPFRSPHHTTSDVALVGGGQYPHPGEISLAHNGVLFLDELPEFNRNVLEALRQPLEDGEVNISRASGSLSYPARFTLVCAMNPCKCGRYGDLKSSCRCTPYQIQQYRSKISGPLLDRIDIHIEVPPINYHEVSDNTPAESSAQIRERVNKARKVQRERFASEGKKSDGIMCNAQMSHRQTRKFCSLGKEEQDLLKMAMSHLNLSARAYDKILKVSRTIADLAGVEQITKEHLSEAIQYRALDRDFFLL